jgi:hypothetical protein
MQTEGEEIMTKHEIIKLAREADLLHKDDNLKSVMFAELLVGLEHFAELIVRDCRDMFVVDSVSWNLLNEKLEHFGVEE